MWQNWSSITCLYCVRSKVVGIALLDFQFFKTLTSAGLSIRHQTWVTRCTIISAKFDWTNSQGSRVCFCRVCRLVFVTVATDFEGYNISGQSQSLWKRRNDSAQVTELYIDEGQPYEQLIRMRRARKAVDSWSMRWICRLPHCLEWIPDGN